MDSYVERTVDHFRMSKLINLPTRQNKEENWGRLLPWNHWNNYPLKKQILFLSIWKKMLVLNSTMKCNTWEDRRAILSYYGVKQFLVHFMVNPHLRIVSRSGDSTTETVEQL